MKDIRRPKKANKKTDEEEMPVTYNDFSMYFCNFENEVFRNQTPDLVEKVREFKKNVQYLMDEEQENLSANSQFEINSELIEGSISDLSQNGEK